MPLELVYSFCRYLRHDFGELNQTDFLKGNTGSPARLGKPKIVLFAHQ